MSKTEQRVGVSGATDLNPPQPNRIWQAVKTVVKNIRRDFLVFLVVLEFLSFVGTAVFICAAVNLTLRNTPIQLNSAGLVVVLLCGVGVMLSFLQGYWQHLINPVDEWER
jgi:hypothetical protein